MITNTKNETKGIYISLEEINSIKPGASIFSSISFSSPDPIEQSKKICGNSPMKLAKKKLVSLTLNILGNTLDMAKGIPPMNLYINK